MIFNPSHEACLTTGDTVIAVGEPTDLTKLQHVLNPNAARTFGGRPIL